MPGRLVFADAAWEDCLHWQRHDRPQLERIHRLIEATRREPFTGPGKPEALQHALAGWWSRRITEEHRMVYRWHDGDLLIAQLRHHYR